jgi:hypothetical protein
MIEQMGNDVFYSTLYNLLLVYVSDNSRNLAMVSHHKQWRDYWCDKETKNEVLAARQHGDCLYKQILFIAALNCVAAFLTPR